MEKTRRSPVPTLNAPSQDENPRRESPPAQVTQTALVATLAACTTILVLFKASRATLLRIRMGKPTQPRCCFEVLRWASQANIARR